MKNRNRGLLVVGAGGHGRVVADIARLSRKYTDIAFIDDAGISISGGIRVIAKIANISEYWDGNDVFVAIGDNGIRKRLQIHVKSQGASLATLIHPSAVIASDVQFGAGTVVLANAVINSGSYIGEGVIINTAATVDHDNRIEDFVHISPGAHLAGDVSIGEGTWIGIGASVSNNIKIIRDCTIGAGAVVIKDIYCPGTYVGIPAQSIVK